MSTELVQYTDKMSPIIHDLENQIVFSVYKDYNNYRKIKHIIDPDKFMDKNLTTLYTWAENLYSKFNYTELSKERLNIIIDEFKVESERKEYLRNQLDLLFLLANSEYTIDIEGTVSQYLKYTGIRQFMNLYNSKGGIDQLLEVFSEDTNMNSQDIKNFFNIKLGDMFKSFEDNDGKVIFLDDGLDQWIVNTIEKKAFGNGIPQIFSKLLNNTTKGIQKGVNLFGSFSGRGKTTWLWILYILPTLLFEDESGNKTEKIYIMANEQDDSIFRLLYLLSVISMILAPLDEKVKTISRDRIVSNRGTEEDQNLLRLTAKYIKDNFSNRIKFEFTQGFDIDHIETVMDRQTKLGIKNFYFDTMKADRVDKYGDLVMLVTKIDLFCKKYDARSVITIQLRLDLIWRRYLKEDCIANAKAIITVVENVLLFREVEYEEAQTLKIKNYVYNKATGKYKYEFIPQKDWLKPKDDMMKGEKYMAFFLGKNRHGDNYKVFLNQCNFDRIWMRELGEIIGMEDDSYMTAPKRV